MDTARRSELARLAVEKAIGSWAYRRDGERNIVVNESFEKSVALMVDILDQQINAFETFFLSLDDDDLQAACGISQSETADSFQGELDQLVRGLNERLGSLDRYHLMAIGAHPHERADYKMWANHDSYSEEELVWLSIGLEPTDELSKSYSNYKNGRRGLVQYIGLEADRRSQILQRSRSLGTYGRGRAQGDKALAWINSVDLGTPKGFRKMLAKSANRLEGGPLPSNQNDDLSLTQMDGREKVAMSKLLAAMAVDAYGFDPTAKRSEIPNEIAGITDRLGLSLSANTIRKYLRKGSELLPDDWEPE